MEAEEGIRAWEPSCHRVHGDATAAAALLRRISVLARGEGMGPAAQGAGEGAEACEERVRRDRKSVV